jgi:hypothetical protein
VRASPEMMPLVTVWPTPKGSPMASTRSPTCTSLRFSIGSTGSRSPLVSIFRTARSDWASASSTRASNSRRSASTTRSCWPPSMTWLFVTMIPSSRTITPEPSEPSTRSRGTEAPPTRAKKGSTWVRTVRVE